MLETKIKLLHKRNKKLPSGFYTNLRSSCSQKCCFH